jgi:hypothetical protein
MRRLGFAVWFLCNLVVAALPVTSHAQILTITLMPPELPVYEQPENSCAGLHLDARLLGVWPGWLLLGSGHLG